MEQKKIAEIQEPWLSVKNFEFKILIMVAVLRDNNLAYCGTLKDMCNFLQISYHSTNTKKIKQAIENLKKQEYINVLIDKYSWTLSLRDTALTKPRFIKLRHTWIDAIKDFKSKENPIDWSNILKVFSYVLIHGQETNSYADIANALNISASQVRKSVLALDKLELEDLTFERHLVKYKDYLTCTYKTAGQNYEVGWDWS